MDQAISVAGALLILSAYVMNQLGRLDRTHAAYNWMNFVGSVILTVVAWRGQQWGFVLLEGAWAAISAVPLVRRRGE